MDVATIHSIMRETGASAPICPGRTLHGFLRFHVTPVFQSGGSKQDIGKRLGMHVIP